MDKVLLFSMIALVIYGSFNIYLATKGRANDLPPFNYVRRQLAWFVFSLIILYFVIVIDYKEIFRYVPIFYWGSVVLLISVWIPHVGVKVNGATGWIRLPGIPQLQPAEVAKFAIILMIAKALDDMDYEINNIKNIFKIFVWAMIPVGLILAQPDMGMTMVCFFIVLGMLFIAGLDRRIIGGGSLALFLAIVVLWNSGFILPYQKGRILSFMSSDAEDSANGYQVNQSIIGIGSGGLWGSRPSINPNVVPGYSGTHVPEVQTDFIFSAIGEQWGLIGAIILLFLYGVLISRMIAIARNTKDRQASVVCIGLVSYFLFAITENIGMTIKIMPTTGITLPLISYGGSSLLTTIVAIGLVLNIGMRKKKIHF
ncbi:rod shape-determining protein RodA [Clostridium sp. SHJSY1]|uniref:FtsW/RodA/SpoVE family cell cycle protein n=1 Tax=Clostridium sp. SHJSY1 TaxID=2942483 RepID=UPI0028765FB2|nr:FtsW/RodA/SpoVE family cell cycle protein [Clostridium sp. SHJSY1]MDS0528021.1 rod shape-determining protein RodA [Clostridium sp. SHJSY1]